MKMTPSRRAFRVTLIYLVFGTLWIYFSDLYLSWLGLDADALIKIQTLKGELYVLITGLLFYLLIRRELTRQNKSDLEAHRRQQTLEALYKATFEHAAVGMVYGSSGGRFERVNHAFCDIVGYSREELLSMSLRDITYPEDVAHIETRMKRMMAGEIASFTVDQRYISKSGNLIWASLTASMIPRSENNRENCYLGVVTNISDRKTAEQALRGSEGKFRALVEQSITGIYVFDREAFRYVNRRLAEMFGYTEAELIDVRAPLDLMAPEDQGTVRAQMDRRLDGKVQSAHYTARGLRKDGTRIWLELHGTRMELDGRPAITGTALDITERVEAEQGLRESEARFRAIYEGVNDAILILDPKTGKILDVNRRAEEMTGLSAEQIRRFDISRFAVGDPALVKEATGQRIEAAASGEPQLFELEARDSRDRPLWVEINMRAARIGGADRILVLARDITGRRASEEKLRMTSQVFHSTREAVMITDAETQILSVNPAFTEITGYTEEEALNKTPQFMQSGFHDRSFYQAMWQSITRTGHWQGEIWNRRKTGETYPEWMSISAVHDEKGRVTNYVGVSTDLSRLKHSEAEVQRLAHYDPLTGLPNRVLFMSRLEHALELRKRRDQGLALLFCGLDRFKFINDSLGYPAGDELLQTVSRRIRSKLQDGDTLARFGGDEFVVLLETIREPEEIAQLAQSLVALSESPVELSTGESIFAGISVGASISPDDGNDGATLVTNANAAMQQAKTEGRHTYRFYQLGLTESARERLYLESRLRRAIDNEEFQLYYQPIVEISSGRTVGAEALIRWIEPESGLMMPEQFIPLAEDTGLIVPLGRQVLESVCRQVVEWRTLGLEGLKVSVNLSSRQFESGTLQEEISSICSETGVEPDTLELEITESMLMEHGEKSMETLAGLRQIGVSVSMDDFGTGYSSLAYLKRFAINKFKIDRIFIRELPHDRDDSEIVSAIIAMAHNLNLRVVAEGVETPEQLEFLKAAGCDEFQGYLVSAPVPASDFASLMSEKVRAAT